MFVFLTILMFSYSIIDSFNLPKDDSYKNIGIMAIFLFHGAISVVYAGVVVDFIRSNMPGLLVQVCW